MFMRILELGSEGSKVQMFDQLLGILVLCSIIELVSQELEVKQLAKKVIQRYSGSGSQIQDSDGQMFESWRFMHI